MLDFHRTCLGISKLNSLEIKCRRLFKPYLCPFPESAGLIT